VGVRVELIVGLMDGIIVRLMDGLDVKLIVGLGVGKNVSLVVGLMVGTARKMLISKKHLKRFVSLGKPKRFKFCSAILKDLAF